MKSHLFFLFSFLFCLSIALEGQSDNTYSLSIKKTDTPILLDGQLLEAAWQEAAVAKDFFQDYPFDTSYASSPTEVRVCFDDQFLYIGATVYQKRANYIISSLKRDFDFGESDEFHVNIDPFKDKLNGFHFAVSPLNVQREGLTDNGANVNTDWDNKWYSQVYNEDDRWTVEMAIPFKTLRYKNHSGSNSWRINFVRVDLKQNEVSSWVPVPRQFDPTSLAFTGELIWEAPPPRPGLNVSLIPYVTGSTERDFEFEFPTEYHANGGLDAKIALTPSLNLDLTINPDFSQVEVDQQLTNLSRFELFFPERRQFFLENQDLFSMFGFPNSRPFFSRRIGLSSGTIKKTTTSGQVIEVDRLVSVPILAGARLSGKLNPNWRIGLLNMTTGAQKDLSLGPANYTVGVLQRKVFERSTIGAVFVNKESFSENPNGAGYRHDATGYNRVAGLEYNLYSKDNKWEAEAFYHRSFSAGDNKDAQAAAVFIGYYPRKWRGYLSSQYIGSGHRADMGFVPRTGFLSLGPGLNYILFPKNSKVKEKIIQYTIGISNDFIFNRPDFQLTDRRHGLSGEIQFNGQSELSVGLSSEYIYLFFPFDPTNSGGKELPEGSEYTFQQIGMSFSSDQRKNLFFYLDFGAGQYFNGNILHAGGSLHYRMQPYGVFGLTFTRDDIRLPAPYNSAKFWLVGPRAELSFSRSLFFSLFLQYNTQSHNVNINSRLQWRFRPVSDLFLVYTDNYLTDNFFFDFPVKNRALVLKITYWLNL
ncbi:MAG: carbohydrate binding family 9 domain-containing protein [Lewinellaceae bacterium]|nr:carbohydrate binding family 9 domain-containing protein [Lewinellaceae bacterium]